VLCGSVCVDPMSSRDFCGAAGDCSGENAGEVCEAGEICNGAGVCSLSCQVGTLDCGGTCIDPRSNRDFCGAEADCAGSNDGDVCADASSCVDGACTNPGTTLFS